MGGKVLLVLKERPSFEGELRISLIEEQDSEGNKKHFVACQKKPPLSESEFAVFAAARNKQSLEDLTSSLDWQREVPPNEAKRIITALEHPVASIVPESILGLDGTSYELLIERGFNRIQFSWWCEPPAAWGALRELSSTLLDLADAASRIEGLQSNKRKKLIWHFQGKLDKDRTRLNDQKAELTKTSNERCLEIARSLSKACLRCPNCGKLSSDIRFVDKSPAGRSYFICQACGRSFRPDDL